MGMRLGGMHRCCFWVRYWLLHPLPYVEAGGRDKITQIDKISINVGMHLGAWTQGSLTFMTTRKGWVAESALALCPTHSNRLCSLIHNFGKTYISYRTTQYTAPCSYFVTNALNARSLPHTLQCTPFCNINNTSKFDTPIKLSSFQLISTSHVWCTLHPM